MYGDDRVQEVEAHVVAENVKQIKQATSAVLHVVYQGYVFFRIRHSDVLKY